MVALPSAAASVASATAESPSGSDSEGRASMSFLRSLRPASVCTGTPSTQPSVSGFSAQKASTLWPAAHARQSAVSAMQHGVAGSSAVALGHAAPRLSPTAVPLRLVLTLHAIARAVSFTWLTISMVLLTMPCTVSLTWLNASLAASPMPENCSCRSSNCCSFLWPASVCMGSKSSPTGSKSSPGTPSPLAGSSAVALGAVALGAVALGHGSPRFLSPKKAPTAVPLIVVLTLHLVTIAVPSPWP
mmetsp:Transcript_23703/g.50724  ORF Transcript_23703/g.50724 Transcript_23703/m.50724 type:complete len:245 (-) Transcript_23703:164-898(-)